MKHDESNFPTGSPDAELEARIVAWVAGEASPFEIAELERLVRTRPELAIFKRRIEAVHGLLGEAARPEQEPLQLSADRRAKLLQALGVPADANTDTATVPPTVLATHAAQRNRRWIYAVGTAAAACAIFGLTIATLTSPLDKRVAPSESSRPVALPRPANEQHAAAENAAQLASQAKREAEVEVHMALAGTPSKGDQPPVAELKFVDSNQFERAPDTALFGAGGAGGRAGKDQLGAGGGIGDATRQTLLPSGERTLSSPLNTGAKEKPAPTPAPTDTLVRMDPFKVNADADVGFVAASSLAGGRVTVALNGAPVPPPADKPAGESVKLEPFSVSSTPNRGFGFSGGLVGTQVMTDDQAKQYVVTTNEFNAPKTRGFLSGLFGSDRRVAEEKKAAAEVVPKASPQADKTPRDVTYVASGAMAGSRITPAEPSLQLSPFAVSENNASAASRAAATAAARKVPASPAEVARVRTDDALPTDARRKEADATRPITPRPALLDAERAGQQSLEISTADEAVSTFSLHVSDVSFRLAAAAFARGEAPDASRIRPEEFYNAFDYGDPTPAAADKVGCKIEQSAHPLLQQRNLLRIAMKVPSTGRGSGTPLQLTVLLDTSGSMQREDRASSVQRAFEVLVSLLGPTDRITLIGFARQPRLMAENVAGNDARNLLALIARTPADGGTNLEEALALATQLARRHHAAGAQNRVVLLTDGAANLGNANPTALAARVTALRDRGIAFDACGVGLSGIDDDVLEALTRQGDGRYYVLNSPEAADSGFARQLAGAFRPAAENVKVQVRFNPARVARQRLIGFEQHRLATEDFRNDAVDAAELAADEAANALYQIEVLPQGTGEVGEVYVRFRDPASGQMVERSWTIAYEPGAAAFDRATPSLQLAGTAALLAEKLRHSTLGDQIRLGDFARVVDNVRQRYAGQPRVQEFVTLFGQARRMFGE